MNKYTESLERSLPYVYYDGTVCQCGVCTEAIAVQREGEIEPDHTLMQRVVGDTQDVHKADAARLFDDDEDDWTDVPFWFAWLVWSTVVSIPVVIPTVLAQHFFHLSDPHALILQAGLAGVIGWLVTLITRWRHQSKINPYWWCSEDVERSRHERPTVNRGGGLHRFSLTVGFKHEHLEDR